MQIRVLRILTTAAVLLMPSLVLASDIIVSDAYARVSRPGAPTGAAFMTIANMGAADDRLLSVASDIAQRVELHTHVDQGDGVMKMSAVEGGIALPAGSSHDLARGGDHLMFMGLTQSLEQGASFVVTLTFENAGDVTVTIPVDNARMPDHGAPGTAQGN